MPTLPQNSTANWRCRPTPDSGLTKLTPDKRPLTACGTLPRRAIKTKRLLGMPQMLSDSSVPRLSESDAIIVDLRLATFGQRIAAGVVDFILAAIFIFLMGQWCSTSKNAASILVVPLALGGSLYSFIGHALYGRTVGKYILKIFVVRLNGSPIGWNESLRRSSVEGICGIVWAIGLVSAIYYLPSDSFHGQGWSALYKLLTPHFPQYVRTMLQAYGFWSWSEFITMLFNRRRRAIHDFIGSTMVIKRV